MGTWQELYTYKTRNRVFYQVHDILFEGDPILVLTGYKESDVSQIVHALNAAYNLGYGSGSLYAKHNLPSTKVTVDRAS